MRNLNCRALESRKLSNMAQMCSKTSSVPCYKRNSRVIFFLSDKKYMAVEAVEWSKWIISVGNVE